MGRLSTETDGRGIEFEPATELDRRPGGSGRFGVLAAAVRHASPAGENGGESSDVPEFEEAELGQDAERHQSEEHRRGHVEQQRIETRRLGGRLELPDGQGRRGERRADDRGDEDQRRPGEQHSQEGERGPHGEGEPCLDVPLAGDELGREGGVTDERSDDEPERGHGEREEDVPEDAPDGRPGDDAECRGDHALETERRGDRRSEEESTAPADDESEEYHAVHRERRPREQQDEPAEHDADRNDIDHARPLVSGINKVIVSYLSRSSDRSVDRPERARLFEVAVSGRRFVAIKSIKFNINTNYMEGTVCVIGAGPAGIVTGKVFLEAGFDVTIYERFDELGGTWSSRRRYVGLAAQADRGLLEFSDLPNDTPFASAERVQAYLRTYARRFDVLERIEFETTVSALERDDDGWTVTTRPTDGDGDPGRSRFEHVVVCSGLHHHPNVPDIPGRDEFDGLVRHASTVDSAAPLADRRVVVVGFGKSALDLSVRAAEVGRESWLVYRRAYWHLPKRLLGGLVPYRYLLFTRLGGALLPRYHNESCVRAVDKLPDGLKRGLWKAVTWDLRRSAGLDGIDEATPEAPLPSGVVRTGVYPDGFVDALERGAITPVRTTIERFDRDGLRLGTGECLPADAVIFGTGFRRDVPFLPADLDCWTDDGRFRAYRSIVPPSTDDLGFVGFRQTFANFLSMEVSAHWLAAYFREALPSMPTRAEMRDAVDRRLAWQTETMTLSDGFEFGPYVLHAVDELLHDLGVSPDRGATPLHEYLLPPATRQYRDVLDRLPP